MNSQDVIRLLGLSPLPREGGHFLQTYKSALQVAGGGSGTRAAMSAIYYFMSREDFSTLHRLKSDEIYHFYAGDPAELVCFDGPTLTRVVLGPDLVRGHRPQIVVPAGAWQASRPLRPFRPQAGDPVGRVGWTLLGTTVCPGYETADFEHGELAALLRAYPDHRDVILEFTK